MKYTLQNTSMAGKPVDVFLDGMVIPNAVEADTRSGMVRYINLASGAPVLKPGTEEIDTITLHGDVVVAPRDGGAMWFPMSAAPKDGSEIEVFTAAGNVRRARWSPDAMILGICGPGMWVWEHEILINGDAPEAWRAAK